MPTLTREDTLRDAQRREKIRAAQEAELAANKEPKPSNQASPLESFGNALVQNQTSHWGDEAAGAFGGGAQSVADYVNTGKPNVSTNYVEARDFARNLNTQTTAPNPKAAMAGAVAGQAINPLNYILPAGIGGALQGLGASTAKDTEGLATDSASGLINALLVNGILQDGYNAGKAIGQTLRSFKGFAGMKAIGAGAGDLAPSAMGKTGEGLNRDVGARLYDDGILGPLNGKQSVYDQAKTLTKKAGEKMDVTLKAGDTKGAEISAKDLGNMVEDYAVNFNPNMPSNRPLTNTVKKVFGDVRASGESTGLQDGQELKGVWDRQASWDKATGGKQGSAEIYKSASNAIGDSIESRIADSLGPNALANYKSVKGDYGFGKEVSYIADRAAGKDAAGMVINPVAHGSLAPLTGKAFQMAGYGAHVGENVAGGLGEASQAVAPTFSGVASTAESLMQSHQTVSTALQHGGVPDEHIQAGVHTALAHGHSPAELAADIPMQPKMGALESNTMGYMIKKYPQALGPYAAPLNEASTHSPQVLDAVHQHLLNSDPTYGALIENLKQQLTSNPGVRTVLRKQIENDPNLSSSEKSSQLSKLNSGNI